LVSDFLTAIFGKNLIAWRLATALITTLLLYVMVYMVNQSNKNYDDKKYISAIMCCSFFLMMPSVIAVSVCWYTGSFHYLWPTFFLVVALIPFYFSAIGKSFDNRILLFVSIICSGLLAYNEQHAAIFTVFGLFVFATLIFFREKVPLFLFIQYAMCLLNLGIYFLLGSTEIRSNSEIYWYKNFPMLSLVDKIFQGVNWVNYNIVNKECILMFILSLLIFILSCYKFKSLILKVCTVFPMGLFLFALLPDDSDFSKFTNYILNPGLANPNNFNTDLFSLFSFFVCITIILYIGGLILVVFENKRISLTNMLLYFAALASGYAVSLSPTIFASGNRIFFVGDILFVFLIGFLLKELTNYVDIKNKIFKVMLTILFLLSSTIILELFYFNFNGGYRF